MTNSHLLAFEEHRPRLFGIAYRMLGSVTDAQDMVQECYLRWQQADPNSIQSPPAWLTTVITRLCINHLQLARVQRESYVGPWLPEPLVDEQAGDPADAAQLADTLSLAFLVLLEKLSPTERAVFILREGFGFDYDVIAGSVGKSEANCRQILARARKRIDERRPRYGASRADAEKLVSSFLAALRDGDVEAMVARMAENVVLVADGGGHPGSLLHPLEGSGAIARIMVSVTRLVALPTDEARRVTVNGMPGVVRFRDGQAQGVLAFGLVGGLIQSVFVIGNPAKLRHLHRSKAV